MFIAVILSGARQREVEGSDGMMGQRERRQGILTMNQKVHQYWVYMVASTTGTLYVGMTNSLERRIQEHKAGEIEGFSKTYDCKRLVYWESYDSVHRAISREKQLKGWRRGRKIALIEKKNPRWQDLSERWSKTLLFPQESMKEADARVEKNKELLRVRENALKQHSRGN